MKQLPSLVWKYQLTLQVNFLLPMINLLLISPNVHFSSYLKNIHMHHNSSSIYLPWPLKVTHYFVFKNCVMSSFLPSDNIYQQTSSGQNTNISKQKIPTYINFSSHHTPILNSLQQKKAVNYSQENSEFFLLNIKLFPPLNHQNDMSNPLHTWITTMVLTFLLFFSLPWVLN